jgi:two-component system aerobic respiration control sensor histidine kinase ArcB
MHIQENNSVKHTVLVVEDHELVAEIISLDFSDLDCDVDIALDGTTAVELAKKNTYDLIMLDIGLPDISGYKVSEQIRAHEVAQDKTPTPIIALTAHAEYPERKQCIASGMNAVFLKPLLYETAKALLEMTIPNTEENMARLRACNRHFIDP